MSTISCYSVWTTTVIYHLQMKSGQQENAQPRLDFLVFILMFEVITVCLIVLQCRISAE